MHRYIFFLNDTTTPEISPLSLHTALPISLEDVALLPRHAVARLDRGQVGQPDRRVVGCARVDRLDGDERGQRQSDRLDRKSTRLNSSHANISYAVFCLKKKKYYLFFFSFP